MTTERQIKPELTAEEILKQKKAEMFLMTDAVINHIMIILMFLKQWSNTPDSLSQTYGRTIQI